MLTTTIVIFREILEISIILSVIASATKELENRRKVIFVGIFGGIISSSIIAFLILNFSHIGLDQEVINIVTLVFTIAMICWTVIWMARNAKLFSQKIKKTTYEVKQGAKSLYFVSFMIALTMLREGAEIMLFLSGIYVSGAEYSNMLQGAVMGLISGSLCGVLIYTGLLKLDFKIIFKICSIFLTFLAASLASELASLLSSVNFITSYSHMLWDSSYILQEESFLGKILHNLIGYDSKPSVMQLIFYTSTILFIYINLGFVKSKKNQIS